MTNANERLGCPDCQLTSVGGAVLSREVDRLRRTRPHGTWQAQVCQRCEQVTHVFDREEGWSLGMPVAEASFVLEPLPWSPADVPEAAEADPEEAEADEAAGALLGDSWAIVAR
jgi:hypothetical protein